MSDSYEQIEARIQAVIASILPDKKPNIAKLARDFAVPASRLRARYNEQNDKSYYKGAGRMLTINQEMTLYNIIKREEIDGTHI